jgi:hypothetical protein
LPAAFFHRYARIFLLRNQGRIDEKDFVIICSEG